jgi:hypothetical protein
MFANPKYQNTIFFLTPNLNLEAVWNFGGNNNDAAGSLLYCCDVSALFRFFKSRTPHFGHSVDECTRSMDLSVSVRSAAEILYKRMAINHSEYYRIVRNKEHI